MNLVIYILFKYTKVLYLSSGNILNRRQHHRRAFTGLLVLLANSDYETKDEYHVGTADD
jgi:hypothetical protein